MFNRSIISTAIITLASLSSVVYAEDTVGSDTSSTEAGTLAELRLSNQSIDKASANVTLMMDSQGNSHIYSSGRNWVTVTDTDNDLNTGSAKHFITKNHR